MRSFDDIRAISADRHGGPEALEEKLAKPDPKVADLPEDRWLATMTKCIFQAGFSWKVIEAKWDGFEEVFHGFEPGPCAFMAEEEFDRILQDTRIVRNGAKLATVRENAALLMELRAEGGAGQVLGGWPSTDYIGLLDMLKKRGSRLGGNTGQYAMRFAGRDSFILSRDVTARLIAEGVIDKPATSKTALKSVQAAFNTWMEQSGRSLTEISRVLAMSC
ncbi:DNA-3-methyladenine glycosylase I [Leisingera sp. HS039]|uniref:DNA-3-methyladenine glycosylase I n=1 Tax=unclassified Leisingera TaxID=2614906 RepID=UPI00107153EE|nr:MULTISPECIES: DNA-3-methyladenine glycosylase I [unclassified Leisingera]MBQ4826478.1 DNA-3-methyladenine glycosylase I [Leisingera sp. HS039]QBR36796.1 3-methyladenine DNA glycosylase [Leisingera sp. NJS201]